MALTRDRMVAKIKIENARMWEAKSRIAMEQATRTHDRAVTRLTELEVELDLLNEQEN